MSLTLHPAEIVESSTSPLVACHASWPRAPLGAIATILNGAAFKSVLFSPSEGVPLIRIRDIAADRTSTRYAGQYDERYLVRPGQLLVGMDGDFNVARWRGEPALLNQRVCRITPVPDLLDLDYLTHILPGYLQAIHDVTSSTTVKHLSSRDIADIPIPVPPITEQQRIAARLDAILMRRVTAAGHLQAARTIVERFRSAVLAAASSGRLTQDWRNEREEDRAPPLLRALPPAATRSKRVAVPDPALVPDGPTEWTHVRLELLIDRIEAGKSFSAHGRPASTAEWGIIKVSAMSWGSFFAAENKAVPEDHAISANYEIRPGDLLISRANTADLVGATVLVGETRPRLLLSDKSLRLIPRAGVDKAWLNYALRSPFVRRQFSQRATGTSESMRNLSQDKILATTLVLPPLAEQHEICRRVGVLLTAADRLTAQIHHVAATLDRVSKASLARAFRGNLVPTEAVLAEEEGRGFESAHELLARIVATGAPLRSRPRSNPHARNRPMRAVEKR